jgi:hypothetical protein
MKLEKIKISKIKRNPANPRLIKDNKFYKLVKSIKEFPEMLEIRPIVVNDDMVVLGGNMRLKACQEAGLKEVPIINANKLTAKQQQEFMVKDNVSFGEWDWDMIANEWDSTLLSDFGMDVWKNYDDEVNKVNSGDENSEWVGMPEFESKNEMLKIIISFETEKDRENFNKKYQLKYTSQKGKTWTVNYPYSKQKDLTSLKYE